MSHCAGGCGIYLLKPHPSGLSYHTSLKNHSCAFTVSLGMQVAERGLEDSCKGRVWCPVTMATVLLPTYSVASPHGPPTVNLIM